jgi:hypothetical protein
VNRPPRLTAEPMHRNTPVNRSFERAVESGSFGGCEFEIQEVRCEP